MTVIRGQRISRSEVKTGDFVIALIGLTGSGKTKFIEHLAPCASYNPSLNTVDKHTGIKALRVLGHGTYGSHIVLLDTPGFDIDPDGTTYKEVIQMLNAWLQDGAQAVELTGLVVVQSLNRDDRRTARPPDEYMLRKLWSAGEAECARRISLVIMFDENVNVGQQRRQKEICEEYWSKMLEGGASFNRLCGIDEKDWYIIEGAVRSRQCEDDGRQETEGGRMVSALNWLRRMLTRE